MMRSPTSSDLLSALPDGVLHAILARLPLRDAVRTAVLARRWRHVWSTNPVLDFASLQCAHRAGGAYVSAVDHCLRLCAPAKQLSHLAFQVDDWGEHSAVFDRWLAFAAARTVEELAVRGGPCEHGAQGGLIKTPPSLFRCSSLRVLLLFRCSVPPFLSDGSRGFPSLSILYLLSVSVTEESLSSLLSACPRLRSLWLWVSTPLSRLVISSPTLESLEVSDNTARRGLHHVEIGYAPRLRQLELYCDVSKVAPLKTVPNLEVVEVCNGWVRAPAFGDRHQWRRFVSGLAHAKLLRVDNWFLQFRLSDDLDFDRRPPVFANLKKLHLEGAGGPFDSTSLHALVANLRDCPSLESLSIHQEQRSWHSDNDVQKSDQLEESGGVGHVLPQLRRFTISGFSGNQEEMRLVEFVMREAAVLETVILFYVTAISKNKLNEISDTMRSFYRASPFVRQSFSDKHPRKI